MTNSGIAGAAAATRGGTGGTGGTAGRGQTGRGQAGNPSGGRAPGKRERLIAAARQVLYEHGVEHATLADIAVAADVPLGNMYYYFKTKDALVSAVIEGYRHDFADLSARAGHADNPAGRLKALLQLLTARQERLARFGCPIGSLSSELDKRDGDLRDEVGTILGAAIDWAETQFRALGRDDARELAVALLAAYQGIAVLAAALRQPDLIGVEAARLNRWIDSLTGSQ
jgi:TetR/AcrR family transcriptional regulator, transcriptional repressor for nem operon